MGGGGGGGGGGHGDCGRRCEGSGGAVGGVRAAAEAWQQHRDDGLPGRGPQRRRSRAGTGAGVSGGGAAHRRTPSGLVHGGRGMSGGVRGVVRHMDGAVARTGRHSWGRATMAFGGRAAVRAHGGGSACGGERQGAGRQWIHGGGVKGGAGVVPAAVSCWRSGRCAATGISGGVAAHHLRAVGQEARGSEHGGGEAGHRPHGAGPEDGAAGHQVARLLTHGGACGQGAVWLCAWHRGARCGAAGLSSAAGRAGRRSRCVPAVHRHRQVLPVGGSYQPEVRRAHEGRAARRARLGGRHLWGDVWVLRQCVRHLRGVRDLHGRTDGLCA